ncbi:MAG: hypothetical protein ACJZ85_01490 [Pontiellaceae bacterium]
MKVDCCCSDVSDKKLKKGDIKMIRLILTCFIFISSYVYANVLDEQHQQLRIYKGFISGDSEADSLGVEIAGRSEQAFVSASYGTTEYDVLDNTDIMSLGFESTTFAISAGPIIDLEDKAYFIPKATFGHSEGRLQTVKSLTEKFISIGFDLGFAINERAVLITSVGIHTIFSSNADSAVANLLSIDKEAFEDERESREVYGSVEFRNKIKDFAYINLGISTLDGVYTSYVGTSINL